MDRTPSSLGVTQCGNMKFLWGSRTYVMGIINMAPDSFSGDGLGDDVEAAERLACQFVEDGAHIIDVGGESTRPPSVYPDAKPVSEEEELRRVLPAIERLAKVLPIPLSIDTYKPGVARQAVDAGATIINDVWGLKRNPDMAKVSAEKGVPIILMHNQEGTEYQDLLSDVIASLRKSVKVALDAGVPWENVIVDPGIGFGKTWEQSMEVLRRLRELKALGCPILVGPSRKSFIGRVLDLPVEERLEGTAAAVTLAIAAGVDIVRVHDVKAMARVCRMADAIVRGHDASS